MTRTTIAHRRTAHVPVTISLSDKPTTAPVTLAAEPWEEAGEIVHANLKRHTVKPEIVSQCVEIVRKLGEASLQDVIGVSKRPKTTVRKALLQAVDGDTLDRRRASTSARRPYLYRVKK